jgi:hypothetical protein
MSLSVSGLLKCAFSSSVFLLSRLEFSDAIAYAPRIRTLIGTAAHLCRVIVPKLKTTVFALTTAPPDQKRESVGACNNHSVKFRMQGGGFRVQGVGFSSGFKDYGSVLKR